LTNVFKSVCVIYLNETWKLSRKQIVWFEVGIPNLIFVIPYSCWIKTVVDTALTTNKRKLNREKVCIFESNFCL
jgi:hypothetical protein